MLTASEHDRRVLQERLQSTRQTLAESKKQCVDQQERLNALTREHEESEVRRSEVENQIKDLNTVCTQHQEAETSGLERIQKLQEEKRVLQERITGLQRAIAQLDSEKRETERGAVRLEKDKNALQKTLDKVERERLKTEEEAVRLVENRGVMDRSMRDMESELEDTKKTCHALQAQLADTEQVNAQRLIDITTRHRQESELEMERLRTAQIQSE